MAYTIFLLDLRDGKIRRRKFDHRSRFAFRVP